MPLKPGYSYDTFRANIAEVSAIGGVALASDIARVYALARKSYFRQHPHGLLPAWLAYPKGNRHRYHYDKQGRPVVFRSNPAPRDEIEQAKRLYTDFTGKRANRVTPIPLRPMPKAGLAFGQLIEIGYISYRDGRPYRHTFRKVSSRPALVASHDGKQVFMLGGAYAFTERGIEDR